jgi:glyoxylase-like metal-dependent hydrolase (beta-lactamase superfamily II)
MTYRSLSRRAFMVDLGRGGLAVAIFGLTAMACSSDPGSESSTTTETEAAPATTPAVTAGVSWKRVNLGFVSAYVLARRGEATIVDTGVSGSEDDIESGLAALDLGWVDVSNVIVTHLHADHQGSLPAVMTLASGATGYAGAADIAGITSPRELTAIGDGDRVFDLRIIETPGHTPGHISVLDEAGRLLVAGDALNGANGTVVGANPDFTSDPVTAGESVKKLAEFSFDTVVFGHGEPVSENASQQVAELASQI